MEISLLQQLKTEFDCPGKDIRTYSPLTLAYIGDAIYELMIRSIIVERGNRSPQSLHKAATSYVKAETQCKLFTLFQEHEELTETELDVMRRGRNAKSYTTAKNASVGDYRRATGVEALFGYLYLTEQTDRAIALLKRGLELMEMEI